MTRKKQNKPELWFELDRRLMHARKVIKKDTGEEFNIGDKLVRVFMYMLDQYNSYHKQQKKFYEDQRDIAAKCCCSPKVAGEAIHILKQLGLIETDETSRCHSYIVRSLDNVANNLIFEYPTLLNGEPSYNHEKALARLKEKTECLY